MIETKIEKVVKVTENYIYFGDKGKSIAMRKNLQGVKVGDRIEITYDWTRRLGSVVSVRLIDA